MLRECCRRNNNGFSLVEVLLAISIFLTVAAILYATLLTGFRMNKRLEEAQRDVQQTSIVLDKFVHDLENMTIFRRENDFVGNTDSMELTLVENSELKRIRYRIAPSTEQSNPECMTLWREERDILNQPEKYQGRVLAENIKPGTFQLAYAYAAQNDPHTLQWEQEWRETYLPAGVHVEFQRCSASVEQTTETVQRNIFVPLGNWGKLAYAGPV